MLELQNVLYVRSQGAVLHLEHDTVTVQLDGEPKRRFPLIRLAGIVVFGRVTATPFLIHRCAESGIFLAWLDCRGRFKARLEGPTRGNVLLRRAQHMALSDSERTTDIARQIVAGKIQNSRQILLRAGREARDQRDRTALEKGASNLAHDLIHLAQVESLDAIRGCEGDAARTYFALFPRMIRVDGSAFPMKGRSRRPPRDRVNALLSLLYAFVRTECAAALEATGLDPQIGFLHALRPGRPGLALDLMEELRPVLADRVALTLINRREIAAHDFEALPGGAVQLSDAGRQALITGYQKRKERQVVHRVLKEPIPLGMIAHVQARLLARHLRGELKHYPPFLYR